MHLSICLHVLSHFGTVELVKHHATMAPGAKKSSLSLSDMLVRGKGQPCVPAKRRRTSSTGAVPVQGKTKERSNAYSRSQATQSKSRSVKSKANCSSCPGTRSKRRKSIRLGSTWMGLRSLTKAASLHKRVHPKMVANCAQCIFHHRRRIWEASTACSHPQSRQGCPGRLIWLAERPQSWGGAWGIGCTLCSAFMARCHGLAEFRNRRVATKWARFEIRSHKSMQLCCLKQHSASALHKLAYMSHLTPDEARWRASTRAELQSMQFVQRLHLHAEA